MNTVLFASGSAAALIGTLGYVLIFVAGFYFLLVRPQKKQQAQLKARQESVAIGDSVLTTAGFYGVVIGVEDDTVVVAFGNNKNCKI